jgi:predicted transcriptional regulator
MSKGNRIKHTFRLPPALSRQLADYAGRKRVSQASVVEAAIASFLSPDGSERMEAAFSRRLDRITRQIGKLDYHIEVGNEAFALYLVEALARRMETGRHLADDLIRAAPEPELGEIENADGNGPESPAQP